MRTGSAASPSDAADELTDLIGTLLDTERRIEELTSGEVDTVAAPNGRQFLLHRAQDQVRQSELARQAAVLNALPANIALLDCRGVIVSVNDAWRRDAVGDTMAGLQLGVGCNYIESCETATGPDSVRIREIGTGLRSVLLGREPSFSIEYPWHSSGKEIWFLVTVTPLDENSTNGVVVMHLDITSRKLAEHETERTLTRLNEAQLELQETQRLAGLGSWYVDFDGRSVRRSDATSRILGLASHLEARSYTELVDEVSTVLIPSSVEKMEVALRKTRAQGDRYETELEIVRPDQSRGWVLARGEAMRDPNGRIHAARGTALDITERKRSELALAQLTQYTAKRERMLSSLLSSIVDFAYAYDRDGRFLFVNQPLLDLWGITLDQAVGRNFFDLGYPETLARRLQNEVEEVFKTRKVLTGETPYTSPSGQSGFFEYIFSPVNGADGTVEFVAGMTRDVSERKRTEHELRTSNEKFHQLADNITDAFWIRSPDMQEVYYISPAFERIWRRPTASLYANPLEWSVYILDEDRERVLAAFAELTGNARTLDLEYRITRPGGEIRWVHSRGFQVRDDAGNLIRIIGIVTDVTEKRLAAEALRTSEEEFRTLAEAMPQIVWITGADGGNLYFNQQWMEYTGLTGEESRGDGWILPFHPEDRQAAQDAWRKATAESGIYSIESRLRRADGIYRWWLIRGTQLKDVDGRSLKWFGTCTDIHDMKMAELGIVNSNRALERSAGALRTSEKEQRQLAEQLEIELTERKLAQIAVQQSRRRLRDIIDGLGPSMFVALLTPEGVLVEVNRPPLEAAGITAEDVLGKHFAETHWWNHSPAVQQQLRQAILRAAAGEPSRYDVRTQGADGAFIDIDFSLQPLRDESGKVVFLIPSASVITERKKAEEALRQAQKMEAVGQLAAGVAHEFNNILQTLMSMATITRLRGVSPEMMKIAAEMEVQIRRGASVTQQLLASSRHQEVTKVKLDLREEVGKARDLVRRLIPENIDVSLETDEECATIEGDAGQIQQVLLNLAINARDAMPDGGRLTLRVACDDAEASFDVEDDGIGFDEKTREHLFEPFFTTKDVGKGTGLGLAVVYGIIEQHGGRIEVRSQPGAGSRFRVIFPRTADEPALAESLPAAALVHATGRILLVEDEAGVREGLTMLLDMAGYDVIAVSSAEGALALPLSPVPDLLLSDVALPGMGGPVLARLLQVRWPSLKITLMSGYIDDATRDASLGQGWDILQKPFELDTLEKHLMAAIGGAAPSLD